MRDIPDQRAAVIVPNADPENILGNIDVTLPYDGMLINSENVRVTDLMNDEVIYEGASDDFTSFTAYIGYSEVGVYLIEKI